MTEKIIVNEKTGGRKGSKPERYSLLPWEVLDEIARVYAFGSEKYDDHNWTKGYDWSLSFDSLIRHATAFWRGEDVDPESGLKHLAHAAWHCIALIYFMEYHKNLDDRHTPKPKKPEPELKVGSIVEFKWIDNEVGIVTDLKANGGRCNTRIQSPDGTEYQIDPKSIVRVLA